MKSYNQKMGFTLIELLLVITIIAILSAFAYPNYQRNVKEAKRIDMMVEMQNIASSIEAQKLAKGTYSKVDVSSYEGNFPRQGNPLYTITINPKEDKKLKNGQWEIISTPVTSSTMVKDGNLKLSHDGVKCRIKSKSDKKCGRSTEWKD